MLITAMLSIVLRDLKMNFHNTLIFVASYFCVISFPEISASQSPKILNDCPPGTKGAPDKNLLTVKELTIKGCNHQPCVMYKTDYYECYGVGIINFTAKSITTSVSALTPLGPLDVYKGSICEYVTSGCENLNRGSEMTLKLKKRIDEWIPPYRGGLRFIFNDENDKPVYCAEINVILKEKTLDFGDVFENLGR